MSAVVVTGASTAIGRALIHTLLTHEPEREVIAVVQPGHPFRNTSPGPWPPELLVVESDLTRPRSVAELLNGPARQHAASAVVHLAGHRNARDDGERVHRLNVESTRELLRLGENHPTIRRFVFRSHAEIYRVRAESACLIEEDQALELSPRAPQWIRDRVEADLTVCTRMGLAPDLEIAVLRLAECISPSAGSQLFDYLSAGTCFRPLGFDPMLNLISVSDAAHALELGLLSDAQGVFNIPGLDVLPLSLAITLARARSVPVPGPLLAPLYGLRAVVAGSDFRYDLNNWRFHFSGVLDGHRAEETLGYAPTVGVNWRAVFPRPGRHSEP